MSAYGASPAHSRTAWSIVPRPDLNIFLDAVEQSRITTLCAPAGYGKTTVMSEWAMALKAKGRPVIWISLDIMADNKLLNALREALKDSRPPSVHGQSTEQEVLDSLSRSDTPPVIIIDDAQNLHSSDISLISRINALPGKGGTIIIATRGRCPVPVARLRTLGHVVEFDVSHLRFSLSEAAQLISAQGGRPVAIDDLTKLVQETGGWVAGLVMASALRHQEWSGHDLTSDRLPRLWHEFADYFQEEVLSRQSEAVQTFLMESAILDELSAAAVVAVTGREQSRALIEEVEAAGLFLEVRNPDQGTYAYHPLFRKMMLRRLNDRDPGLVARLNQRASLFFAETGQPLKALDYAKASGDRVFLADQLDALSEAMTYSGHLYRIDELGSDLPKAMLSTRPMLLLALAWRRIRSLAFPSAETLISEAEACVDRAESRESLSPHEVEHLRLLIEHRRIILLAARDDMAGVERGAEALLQKMGDDHPYLSCSLLAQLISARRELYHFHDMLKLEAEMRKALGRPGSTFASIALKSSVAPTLMAQGKTVIVQGFLEEALELAQSVSGQGSGLSALPALPLAEVLYECGDLKRAGELVENHLPVARVWAFIDQLAAGYIVRARLLMVGGEMQKALACLDEAHLIAIECGLKRLRALIVGEQVRILVKNGQINEAAAAFQAGDMPRQTEPVPTHMSTRLDESVAIAWLRLEMHSDRLSRARKVAKRWSDFVRQRGAMRSAVVFELLLAEIAALSGDRGEARRSVRQAVSLAATTGWMRIFLDEGEVIGSLIIEAYGNGPTPDTPTDRLAASLVCAFQGSPAADPEGDFGLGSQLSSREVDVLRMVSGGLRNREIGDRLGLTEGTVKWYMQQIYDKLGVRRRPQAVLRARHLGMLA